tara:strand:+ start:3004 stop:5298 length:2295 start_codon:yes stop_codon:yes gene_type:complete
MGVKDIMTEAQRAAEEIKKLGNEIVELTKDLEGLEEGTADYEKVNSKLQTKMKQLNVQVKQNTIDHKNSKNAIDAKIRSLRTLQGTLDRNSIEYAKASQSIREHQQSLNQNSAATGLASTSAMEFGRVISDAPYGIRGMANNVSQLTSLLFQGAGQISATTGKVVGLNGAIKGMFSALAGPLGIMIAIQAVIAAVDLFAGSTKKATKEVESLNNSLENQIEVMSRASESFTSGSGNLLTSILGDSWEDDLKILNNEFSDFSNKIKSLTEEQRSDKDAVSFYVAEYGKLLDVRSKISLSEQKSSELREELKDASEAEKGLYKERIENEAELRYRLLLRKATLEDIFKVEKDGKSKGSVKDFALNQSKIGAALTKSLREQELLLAESNAEKLRLNNQYAEEDLLTAFNSEVEKDAAKLEVFLKSKASPEQKAEATRIHEENEKIRTSEYEESLTQIRYNAFIKENQLIEETRQAFSEQSIEKEIEREQNRLATLEEYLGNDPKSLAVLEEQQRLIWEKEDENFEINLERRRTELFALYEDETQVQQIIDEERADRDRIRAEGEIQLERDKADAKMAIQLEYINYVKGLGQVLSILGKKNEGLAIAGLAVEKGAAIASIVVKAQASNAKASAASLEFASLTAAANAPLGPAGAGLTASMIAANEASTNAQRAKTNINAGLSIAKIAATTLTSSALGGSSSSNSSSGGGGGGSTTFTPNFNVVGNSGANQLAEGISSQVNEPTRAYVVYEDIAEAGSVVEESIESSGI